MSFIKIKTTWPFCYHDVNNCARIIKKVFFKRKFIYITRDSVLVTIQSAFRRLREVFSHAAITA